MTLRYVFKYSFWNINKVFLICKFDAGEVSIFEDSIQAIVLNPKVFPYCWFHKENKSRIFEQKYLRLYQKNYRVKTGFSIIQQFTSTWAPSTFLWEGVQYLGHTTAKLQVVVWLWCWRVNHPKINGNVFQCIPLQEPKQIDVKHSFI